jgi:GNAT superfamily N-acetyltransferase
MAEASSVHQYGSVQIRKATESDARSLAELNVVVQELHFGEEPGRFKPPDAASFEPVVRDWLRRPDMTAFIAEDERGASVGYVLAVLHERPDHPLVYGRRFVELDQIAVLPDYRRCGVGRLLASCVMAFARQQGVSDVELATWEFNEGAHSFFAKLGFIPKVRRMVAPVGLPITEFGTTGGSDGVGGKHLFGDPL